MSLLLLSLFPNSFLIFLNIHLVFTSSSAVCASEEEERERGGDKGRGREDRDKEEKIVGG